MKNICLEVTLKPFKDKSPEGFKKACDAMFRQWLPLLSHAEGVEVMLWAADGSELLDYDGDLDSTFEWSCYIGSANPHDKEGDETIARKPVFYCENPPSFCHRDIRELIGALRASVREICGKPLKVGAIFDPGPEFAKSSFKYERHREICTGNPSIASTAACGEGFVYCAENLKADPRPYAGFPKGIPDGTPFGVFLGRQAKCYFRDVGFDFLWLSNGFGFGRDTWGIIGSTFDGKTFFPEQGKEVREGIMGFWRDFRRECPDIPLRSRGTNSTTGVDISTDAVPLREIYSEVSDLEVPPNSPWAPLNGDFGLELAGWMSHIAELPAGKSFLFRYYIHDPWWAFSPWTQQYQRKAYDVYLPLAVARLNASGKVENPQNVSLLTVDTSYGTMPSDVPNEVIPEILGSYATLPDEAGPVVWLYPFEEYHDLAFEKGAPEEVFFGDFFMRNAINLGFPVNTVVSTGNFLKSLENGASYGACVLVAPSVVALDQAAWSRLEGRLAAGGKVVLYGPVEDAGLLECLGQEACEGIEGDMELRIGGEAFPVRHTAFLSGGSLNARTIPRPGIESLAEYRQGGECRSAVVRVVDPSWKGGELFWIRGTNSFSMAPSGFNTVMFDRREFYYPELMMQDILRKCGYVVEFEKLSPWQSEPVLNFRRHANAIYMAYYGVDTTVGLRLRFPEGAPVFMAGETVIVDGVASYRPGKAANWECRFFIEQSHGIVSCAERGVKAAGLKRKILIEGLENATVRFRPEPGFEKNTAFTCEESGKVCQSSLRKNFGGTVLEVSGVSGSLQITW